MKDCVAAVLGAKKTARAVRALRSAAARGRDLTFPHIAICYHDFRIKAARGCGGEFEPMWGRWQVCVRHSAAAVPPAQELFAGSKDKKTP